VDVSDIAQNAWYNGSMFSPVTRSLGLEYSIADEGGEMTNQKLQAALDELERLRDTVREFEKRGSGTPNPDSDVGRALDSLATFSSGMHKLEISRLLNRSKS
jgi:hypothetical protein